MAIAIGPMRSSFHRTPMRLGELPRGLKPVQRRVITPVDFRGPASLFSLHRPEWRLAIEFASRSAQTWVPRIREADLALLHLLRPRPGAEGQHGLAADVARARAQARIRRHHRRGWRPWPRDGLLSRQ